jgi:DNA-binding MarR family transcriptional regulator
VWMMLLELSVAKLRQQRLATGDVCRASGVAVTTAQRQLIVLQEKGLVQRRPDPEDRRRCWIEIAPEALELMIRWAETIPAHDRAG